MKKLTDIFLSQIDKERNIYELADLYHQNRRPVGEYLNILKDPFSNEPLSIKSDRLVGDNTYVISENIANFTESNVNSIEWMKLNANDPL